MEQLVDEGVIPPARFGKQVEDWQNRKFVRILLWCLGWILPLCFAGCLWKSFPSWCPPGKTMWFANPDGTPNLSGWLYLVQAVILTLISFAYLIDTVRLAMFHHQLTNRKDEAQAFGELAFWPQHPDGAFGYGLLAHSMNWAGIVGLFALTIIMVAIAHKAAVVVSTGQSLFDPLLAVNSILCFMFFPWIVVGPVGPFIALLFQRKRDYLIALRQRVAPNMSETPSDPRDLDFMLKRWEALTKGRPYILEKKAIFVILGSVLLTQAIRISEVLVYITKINLSL
ncbi:MAG: hypothetical protein ACYST6_01985 [Planctomycetota bacterium]